MAGFIIWAVTGVLLIVLGVVDFFAKKPVGFWANTKTMKVNDIKGYNRATGKLFMVYGAIFILLGLPLLGGKTALILVSSIGVMLETIIVMAIYAIVITNKYNVENGKKS